MALIVGVLFYVFVWRNSKFQSMISGMGGGTTTDTGDTGGDTGGDTSGGDTTGGDTGGDTGGQTAPSGKSPYPTTGGTWQFKDSGSKTRHYASDGSSGTT